MSLSKINNANRSLKQLNVFFDKGLDVKNLETISSNIGIQPVVFYKDMEISIDYIESFELKNTKFLPEFSIVFSDISSIFSDDLFPEKDDIMSLMIKSNTKKNKDIIIDFKITDIYKVTENYKSSAKFKINTIMDIEELYYTNFDSFTGTSFDLIKEATKKTKLGMVSNISNSKDEMTWLNLHQTNLMYIKESIKYSFIDDETFIWAYIDFYYNVVYIDMEKQLRGDISGQKSPSSIEMIDPDKKQIDLDLILTNSPYYKGSNLFIDKYLLINKDKKVELDIGSNHTMAFYKKKEKEYVYKKVNIIGNKDCKYCEEENKVTYLGKFDTDNVHEHFPTAFIHNSVNLVNLQKNSLNIILKIPNFSLFRLQKISVKIYKENSLQDFENVNKKSYGDMQEDKLNSTISGEWLITSIVFKYDFKNKLYQEVGLSKKELKTE